MYIYTRIRINIIICTPMPLDGCFTHRHVGDDDDDDNGDDDDDYDITHAKLILHVRCTNKLLLL